MGTMIWHGVIARNQCVMRNAGSSFFQSIPSGKAGLARSMFMLIKDGGHGPLGKGNGAVNGYPGSLHVNRDRYPLVN